ncbi:MAG: IS200/IS605 family accessory protein TnpB-related protein (plasmid) [Phormidium sp.]
MFKTIPIKANFTEEEKIFWVDQCKNSNSLINCAIYHARQTHYTRLSDMDNAFTTYWVGDELRSGWKTYKCNANYSELCSILKENIYYRAMAAQAAQQTLQTVGESINSYNKLVNLYYKGEVNKPSLPRYRKKGGLAAITFPKQALTYKNGCFYPSISRETKPELITEVSLPLPEFINADWVREVRIRPNLGEFWIDWIIDDGKKPININTNLDYSQAWGFAHGGTNWLTGVSTLGKSLIIDGRKLKSMNQGYCRLVAKYKQGKSEFYWDANLDRIQRKRNNQMRDAINKAARFIINQCLNDRMGNLVIGWNELQKNRSDMGKRNNQNFVAIPTGRLIKRLKQLCPEYGIVLTITEEANTSKASFLDDDSLPKHGEKPATWKASGTRIKRGLYRTKLGYLVNADANAAANIIKKVATQLDLCLAEVGRSSLALPQRIDLDRKLSKSYREKALRSVCLDHVTTSF